MSTVDVKAARNLGKVILTGWREATTREIRQRNVLGLFYLLLAEPLEDSVGALVYVSDQEIKLGELFTSMIKGMPGWSDKDCTEMLEQFKGIVEGMSLDIQTMRGRASLMLREITEDSRRMKYTEVLEDLN